MIKNGKDRCKGICAHFRGTKGSSEARDGASGARVLKQREATHGWGLRVLRES